MILNELYGCRVLINLFGLTYALSALGFGWGFGYMLAVEVHPCDMRYCCAMVHLG